MSDDTHDEEQLQAWFDAARRQPPEVPEALMRRVLADARAVQATAPPRPGPLARARAGLARATAALGGRPAVAGLAAAGLAGVWLGIYPPAVLQTLGGGLLNGAARPDARYSVDLVPGGEFDAPAPAGEEVNDV